MLPPAMGRGSLQLLALARVQLVRLQPALALAQALRLMAVVFCHHRHSAALLRRWLSTRTWPVRQG